MPTKQSTGVRVAALALLLAAAAAHQARADEASAMAMEARGNEVAVLTTAPAVPPPITRDHATNVVVNMEVRELRGRLFDGVDYTFWTFGGTVPGPMIRVREGDNVEFNLSNHPSSKLPHNIDLHAVTGPGGGAAASNTAPGRTSTFKFKAINPGLYIYHCATAPVGMHVANGMYGLILVEPEGGLPPVDREYYVVQSEFYTDGAYGDTGLQAFNWEKALAENPDYVVFNGSVGALVGDNSLKAVAGETVRLYMGNGGPNLVSSFHVIGEVFDKVYLEGGTGTPNENVQSTIIPAGGSAIVDMDMQVAGTNILVDHSIFRAFNKGALGIIDVAPNPDAIAKAKEEEIYSGKVADTPYVPDDAVAVADTYAPATQEDRFRHGEGLYGQVCAACHQKDGEGVPGAFPPLAGADFLNDDPVRAIDVIVNGLTGRINVNGIEYNGVMPPMQLTDQEVASVLTYVYDNWGNAGHDIDPADVAKVRNGS